MPTASPNDPARRAPSVFLSYASEDREAAQVIRDSLPGLGLEVWYDESALNGGDAWDQKIRRQIRDCDYFMPLVSAQTQARHEGYFRREWRLAVERSLDMADDHTFLLPIVIDDTEQSDARVPEKFLAVQWLRLMGGRPTPAFEALCRRLVSGEPADSRPKARAPDAPQQPRRRSQGTGLAYPEFPREEPGQKIRFWVHVIGWALQSTRVSFSRLPKWIRVIIPVWLIIGVASKGCDSSADHPKKMPPAAAEKLKQIADSYQTGVNKSDVANLRAQIAQAFSDEAGETPTAGAALLAIPFTAPSNDATAVKLANETFVQVYGTVSISHQKRVGLASEPLTSSDPAVAAERGKENHSTFVLSGAIEGRAPQQKLTIRIVTVADASVSWSQSYTLAGADPAKIAAEVDSKVPSLEDE